jgi:hypothetical protein
MKEKIEEIASIFNERRNGWYSLKPKLEQLLGAKTWKKLIDEFESELSSFPKGKGPHYSLVFYLALMIIISDDVNKKKVVQYVKEKNSYRLMIRGLELLLSSQSKTLRYEAELTAHEYKNKYEYVSHFSGYVPDYQIDMRGYLLLLQFLYEANRNDFWRVLEKDQQNAIFLCVMLGGELSFPCEELIPLLASDDELKANGAFFHFMQHYQFYLMEGNEEKTIEETEKIARILQRLPVEKRIALIINYMFVEKDHPSIFVEELQKTDGELLVQHLQRQELEKLHQLVKLCPFMKITQDEKIEKLFVEYFLQWLSNVGNPYGWDSSKERVKDMIGLLSPGVKAELVKELSIIKENLLISSFDRQVRYSRYYRDKEREKVVEEVVLVCAK